MLNRANILSIATLLVVAVASPAIASIDSDFGPLRPSFSTAANWLMPQGILATSGSVGAGNRSVAVLEANLKPIPVTVPRAADYGLFGSVALPISTLPASRFWQRVSSMDFSAQYGARCTSSACSNGLGLLLKKAALMARDEPTMDALSLINSSVNKLVHYRPDTVDTWSTPVETAASGVGDCEDFAIAKMWLLRSIGYRADQLQLVVLRDARTTAFHAVLAVHVGGMSFILDNMSGRVLPDTMLKNYVPIESFAGDKTFIHGFAHKLVQTASLPTT